MYSLLYKVAGSYGIIDTEDGVIEVIDKVTLDNLTAHGVEIAGVSEGSYFTKSVCVNYQKLNWGENGGNVFSYPLVSTKQSETTGKFTLFVQIGAGKKKKYEGTYEIRDGVNMTYEGVYKTHGGCYEGSEQGVVISFKNGVRTVIPVSLFEQALAQK